MQITSKALDQIREDLNKLGPLEKNLIRNNQRIAGYDHDLPAVMEIMLEMLALSILFDGIGQMPPFTEDIATLSTDVMKVESAGAQSYQKSVRQHCLLHNGISKFERL